MIHSDDRAEKFKAKLAALSSEYAKRQTTLIADYQAAWIYFLEASGGEEKWAETLERLIFISHSLAGSSGTFGFEEISVTANKIEENLRRVRDRGSLEDRMRKTLNDLALELKD